MNENAPFFEAANNSETASLVSIVIPVYNVSRYLAECLESVIHQRFESNLSGFTVKFPAYDVVLLLGRKIAPDNKKYPKKKTV